MASVQKRSDCVNFLSAYNPDFLCLSETWLDTTDNILPDCGYTVISQNNRQNGTHGEAAIVYKSCSQCSAYDFTSADYDFACGCIINSDPLCLLLLFTTHRFLPSTRFRVMCSTRVFYHKLVDLLLGILMALFVFAATLIPQMSVGRLIPLVQTIQI